MTLQLHILNATLTIHEHSLGNTSKPTSSDPAAQLQRIENLWTCLTAVQSWFNTFFCPESFPLSSYTHFSMATLTQMGHCLVGLFRLSTFEAPDIPWDRRRVRQEMDLGDIIKHIVESWEQLPIVAGIEIPRSASGKGDITKLIVDSWENVPRVASIEIPRSGGQRAGERGDTQMFEGSWFYAMKGLLVVRSCWEAKVAAMTAADAEREGGPRPEDNGTANEFGIAGSQQMGALDFGAMNLDLMDDTWIRDMLGGCDFNL